MPLSFCLWFCGSCTEVICQIFGLYFRRSASWTSNACDGQHQVRREFVKVWPQQFWVEITVEVLRQLDVVKTEALQGKKFLHYLQQEVARFQDIEDFVVKDSGYFMDLCLRGA